MIVVIVVPSKTDHAHPFYRPDRRGFFLFLLGCLYWVLTWTGLDGNRRLRRVPSSASEFQPGYHPV